MNSEQFSFGRARPTTYIAAIWAINIWAINRYLLYVRKKKCFVKFLFEKFLPVDVLDQLGHCLGVCVRLEDEALGGEELLDLLVVGDDPVVHHHKLVVLARPFVG